MCWWFSLVPSLCHGALSLFTFHSCVIPPFFSSLQAQAVTLTVAQAFKVALDLWEIAQEGESTEQKGRRRRDSSVKGSHLELFRNKKEGSKERLQSNVTGNSSGREES